MDSELIYQISLTRIPRIGPVQARLLIERFGTASAIFRASAASLEKIEGIGYAKARSISSYRDFSSAEEEISFLEKFRIRPLFLTDTKYPTRLKNCYDPPILLFCRGEIDLNLPKVIAIVGTRHNTAYGREVTEQLIKDLAALGLLVVSGLAYGIDAIAHKAALKYGLPTVAVLAHGLDQIYPAVHKGLARDMIAAGGALITEFPKDTQPDKHHFPTRNRVVSGMCDAVIVVESGIKGGSMVTAELANSYNRDVFAFPGKSVDLKSEGCNYLIRANKAILLGSAADLMESMGWTERKPSPVHLQKELFVQLSEDDKVIVEMFKEKKLLHIDEINQQCGLSSSTVAATILALELKGIVRSMPGKLYELAN